MRTTFFAAACFAFALSSPALALTLGEVDVNSALNQQLSATIPVTGIGPDEQDTLRASIASQAAFERAGLRRDALFDDVKVDLIPGPGADRATIKLLSKRRVSEPFLSFLVEVRWAGGGTIREYTVLLDPPNLARAPAPGPRAAGAARSAPSFDDEVALEEDEGVVESIGPDSSSAPARRSGSAGARSASRPTSGRSYGPVSRQETLWSIAYRERPDSSITMAQMQLAIYRANPHAFDGNMNRMRSGVMLTIPDVSEIREVGSGTARGEVARQKTASYGGSSSPRRARIASSAPAPRASSAPKRPRPAPAPEPIAETPEPVTEAEAEAEAEIPAPAPAPATVAQAPSQPAEKTAPVEAPVLAPETDKAAPGADPASGAAMVDPETPSGTPSATTPDTGSTTPGGVDPETPPATAAAPDAAPGEGENLQMPSIWAEGEQPPAEQQPAAPAPQTSPVAETEGGGLGGVFAAISEFKLQLLALIAVLAALAGLAIYRRRKQQESATPPLPLVEFDEQSNVADLEQGLPQAPTAVWQGQDTPAPTSTGAEPEEITSTFDFDALLSGTPPTPPPVRAPARAAPPPPAAPAPAPSTGRTAVMPTPPIPVRETDYLGEAELHIAYGLYDEAAAVLNRGVEENPTRRDLWLKLLEVYAEARNAQDYVVAADSFRQKAKPNDAEWAKVIEKGRELAPDAPLFAGGGGSAKGAAKPATTELDLGASFDLPATPAAPAPAAPKAAAKSEVIEFDLSEFDAPKPASAPSAPASKPPPAPPAAAEGIDLDLAAFDSALSASAKTEAPTAAPAAKAVPAADLTADLDFKLGEAAAAAAPASDGGIDLGGLTATEAAGGDEEASVKLDLARAYLDMGETDMARGLLQEVASSGSAQQKREAQELLTRA